MDDETKIVTVNKQKYIRSVLFDDLIDSILSDLVRRKPPSPCNVVKMLMDSLQQHSVEYYRRVSDAFGEFVENLNLYGFSSAEKGVFFFAIPNPCDGTLMELFPFSSRVQVTASNYTSFLRMLHRRQNGLLLLMNDIPVNPQMHLEGNYAPIASFILEHLTDRNSKWYVGSEEVWNSFGVTYCVPFNGKLHELRPNSLEKYVPFDDAVNFAGKAIAKLLQLVRESSDKTHKHWMVLKSRGYSEFLSTLGLAGTPSGVPLTEEKFNSFHLTYSIPFGDTHIPLSPRSADEPVKFTDKDDFVSMATKKLKDCIVKESGSDVTSITTSLKEESTIDEARSICEEEFWEYIDSLKWADKSFLENLCFELCVLSQRVSLKKNGHLIPVTEDNVSEYIELVYAQRGVIHEAFLKNEVENSYYPVSQSYPQSETLSIHADLFRRHPPQYSRKWNSFRLVPGDITVQMCHNIALFTSPEYLKRMDHTFGDLTFAIHVEHKGAYKLVPGGDEIPVTYENRELFLKRFGFERDRLYQIYMKQDFLKNLIDKPEDEIPTISLPQEPEDVLEYTHIGEEASVVGGLIDAKLGVASHVTLDEIEEYENYLKKLRIHKSDMSPKDFQQLDLRYTLNFSSGSIELDEGGSEACVTLENLDLYVRKGLDMLKRIKSHMKTTVN